MVEEILYGVGVRAEGRYKNWFLFGSFDTKSKQAREREREQTEAAHPYFFKI